MREGREILCGSILISSFIHDVISLFSSWYPISKFESSSVPYGQISYPFGELLSSIRQVENVSVFSICCPPDLQYCGLLLQSADQNCLRFGIADGMSDEDSGPSTSKRTKLDNETDESGECIELSESIFMFPNRTIGQHDNVYEGEVRSSVYGVRPCVIKFAEISEQNVREAEILTKLGSHTNVIAIIQSGTYCDGLEDRVYIALDKCHNENLRQYLANRKAAGIKFDLNLAIDFAKQIIVGVMYIHDNNVIHLDLKPSNILISQNLQLIKIADFGLSIVVKSPKSKVFHKHQFGTNGYRPIESFGNGEVSMRTDIFSLGTVLLHILSNGNDVFGVDEHTFIHNVMNDVTDTTGLLVCNPVTTEHLIKCMVSKERWRRPSIWEVFDHPCWTGKEVECNFEYFGDDEVHDDATDDVDVAVKKEIASTSNIERERNFLVKMIEMGFNRKPTILAFDDESDHLHRFHFENKSMTKMHSSPNYVRGHNAITFGEYIYLFDGDEDSSYRLEYGDVTATWERISWPDGIEMEWVPLVTASSDAIFLVGGSTDRFIFKYNPPLDQWEMLPDRSINICRSVVYSNGFLYCVGLDNFGEPNIKVERLNLETMKWERMAETNRRGLDYAVVECGENIYFIGNNRFNPSDIYIEKFDPKVDKWTELKPVMIEDLQKSVRIGFVLKDETIINGFAIYGDLYIVFDQHILKYDVKKNEVDIFASFPDMVISNAVLVKMSD